MTTSALNWPLRRATLDEVLRGLLVEIVELDPLVAGQVIGEPRLTALGLAANPVAHDEALVGIALALDGFDVVELSFEAAQRGGVGAGRLDAEIELRNARHLR